MKKDKAMHLIVSCGIVLVCLLLFHGAVIPAVLITLTVGVAKEFYDTVFDGWDLVADLTGIALGVWLYFL